MTAIKKHFKILSGNSVANGRTDGRTDRRTDGRTDVRHTIIRPNIHLQQHELYVYESILCYEHDDFCWRWQERRANR